MFDLNITPMDAFLIRAFIVVGIGYFFVGMISDIKFMLENRE